MLAPKITVVTPSFNQAKYLCQTMESVLDQGYPNLEYIVLDGGSKDGSVDIIKSYEKYLTYWRSENDDGQYAAIDEGFKKSSGDIMTWINSDDVFGDDCFLQVYRAFKGNPFCEWLTGRPNHIDSQGQLTYEIPDAPKYSRFRYLCKDFHRPFIQQEGTFWRRSLWSRAGGSMRRDLQLAGDLELWVRFFRYARLYVLDDKLASYRLHGQNKAQLYLKDYMIEAIEIIQREIQNYESGVYSYMPLPPPPIQPASDRQLEALKSTIRKITL